MLTELVWPPRRIVPWSSRR